MSKSLFRNKPLLGLVAAALFGELAYAILNLSAMPMYVTYTLHQGEFYGIIYAVFLAAEALSRPGFGTLGDRIGRKPLLIAGPAVTAVTAYLTIHFQNSHILLLLRAIDGLGSGALWITVFAAASDLADEENRTTAMSMLNVAYMAGMALGFLIGGSANEYFHSYTASFYVVSILLACCVFCMLAFIPKKIEHHAHAHSDGLEEYGSFQVSHLFRSLKEVPDIIVIAFVAFLGMGMLIPIVKLYAVQHLGMNETQFGVAVAPIAAVMGLSAVPMGRVGDKIGKSVAVCWGLLGTAVAMWMIALFRNLIVVGFAGIIIGFGFTITFPAWMALVASSTTPSRKGEVLGAVGLFQGVSTIFGSVLGGFIYNSDLVSLPRLGVVNYNVPFWISAICLTAAAVMSFTWMDKNHGDHEAGKSVTPAQRRIVAALSVAALIWFCSWIAVRYTMPVAPDRVAWSWMQQLVRNRPDKALKYTNDDFDGTCNADTATKLAAKRYSEWKKYDGRYTVLLPESVTDTSADVPVKFAFPGKSPKVEHVILKKAESGEWKVCGVRSDNGS